MACLLRRTEGAASIAFAVTVIGAGVATKADPYFILYFFIALFSVAVQGRFALAARKLHMIDNLFRWA